MNIEILNSGNLAATIPLTSAATLYYVGRVDGVANKVHYLKSLDFWIDNPATTDGNYEVIIARCTTSGVDTEWGAITSQKWDSAAGAAVAATAYIPSGGTPVPTTGLVRLANYGGISNASRFFRLFNIPINPSESLLIAAQHPVASRNCRWTMEIGTP